jgi:hypothetical protein
LILKIKIYQTQKRKIKVDFTKYIEYLNENTDITLRTFCRKFNLKKADSISILKSLECNNYQHKLIETGVINKRILNCAIFKYIFACSTPQK